MRSSLKLFRLSVQCSVDRQPASARSDLRDWASLERATKEWTGIVRGRWQSSNHVGLQIGVDVKQRAMVVWKLRYAGWHAGPANSS